MNKKHIVSFDMGVSREDREKRNGHKAVVVWLTGLPCAGKSTVARGLQQKLFERNCRVFVLDGDNLRHGLNADLKFSPQDREENIRRTGEVAKLFVEAGMIVVTAFISPYRKDRDRVRALFKRGEFTEVYVNASLSICEQRDPKGLYKKARKGEINGYTGISAPYEPPEKPEIVLDTGRQSKEENVSAILNYLEQQKVFL